MVLKRLEVIFVVSHSFTVLFWEKHDLYFIDQNLMPHWKYIQTKERNSTKRKKGKRTEHGFLIKKRITYLDF